MLRGCAFPRYTHTHIYMYVCIRRCLYVTQLPGSVKNLKTVTDIYIYIQSTLVISKSKEL